MDLCRPQNQTTTRSSEGRRSPPRERKVGLGTHRARDAHTMRHSHVDEPKPCRKSANRPLPARRRGEERQQTTKIAAIGIARLLTSKMLLYPRKDYSNCLNPHLNISSRAKRCEVNVLTLSASQPSSPMLMLWSNVTLSRPGTHQTRKETAASIGNSLRSIRRA